MKLDISKETIDETFKKLRDHLELKRVQKGKKSFDCYRSGYFKIAEEHYEILDAMHRKNEQDYADECYDLCVAALWNIMSSVENAKFEAEKRRLDRIMDIEVKYGN